MLIDLSIRQSQPLMPSLSPAELADAWWLNQKNIDGYREGVSAGPNGEQLAIEISSWMQVPHILQLIQKDPSCSIRVVFPDRGDQGIRDEQTAIRDFLRSNHSKAIEELADELGQRIDACGLFNSSNLPSKSQFPTGADWVRAHAAVASYNQVQLGVTDIVTIEGCTQQRPDLRRDVIASALTESCAVGIPVVIVVPDEVAVLDSAATLAKEVLDNDSQLSQAADSAQVWIGGDEPIFGASIHPAQLKLPRAVALVDFVASYAHTPPPTPSPVTTPLGSTPIPTAPPIPTHVQPAAPTPTASAPSAHDVIRGVSRAPNPQSVDQYLKDYAQLVNSTLMVIGNESLHTFNPQAVATFPTLSSFLVSTLRHNLKAHTSGGIGSPSNQTPSTNPAPSAHELLDRCKSKSLVEACKAARENLDKLDSCRRQSLISGTSQQVGSVVLLPDKGTTYFLTDLEGSVDRIAELLDQENILERWRKNDPDDQVYLCVLGDFVDRSRTGGLLFEFLLDLKFREGFERQILVAPGNHEFYIDQHISSSRDITRAVIDRDKGDVGFCEEMLAWRHLDADQASLNDPYVQEMISLCPPWLNPEAEGLDATEAKLFRARAGLWVTFVASFNILPKTALGEKGLFASHAGFPVTPRFTGLASPTGTAGSSNPCGPGGLISLLPDEIEQITWNDFDSSPDSDPNLFKPNPARGVGYLFGDKAFERFGAVTGSTLMVRGHQSRVPNNANLAKLTGSPTTTTRSWQSDLIFTLVDAKFGDFATLDLSIDKPSPAEIQVRKLKNP
jgi:hypothetical protein